ncbi:TlpA disulfide reductase family protein [Flavobacterium sp.]|uniref:TlpA disulfide reductase family protein n=1 Tax=Flavobacterium sp. TaxID=239 RepID=UPI00260DE931|nr:TlpA disulfide reductase family protein [Flavobacterium sp.]
MKKIIAIIALSGLVMSCNGIIGDGYEISGEINGLTDGTRVFLQKQDPKKGIVAVDTAKVEKGKFTFEGEAKEPEMYSISIENVQGGFGVIVEKGNIKAIVDKDSIFKTKLSGTYNNDELTKFNDKAFLMQKKMMAYEKTNTPAMQQASQTKDTVVMNKLRKGYAKFQQDFINENYKYITDNPKSFLSVLLIEGMLKDMEPKFDQIKKYYDGLDPEVKQTKPGRAIKARLDSDSAVAIGRKAPEFSAPNPDGKMISLKESLGKVTIIDFWASWCEPCRKEMPNVVAMYNEFHSKGLNIVGVALEKKGERAQWKEAIAKDQSNWVHVSNLQYWDEPVAKKYSVQGIPAVFVLDKNGVIVAKNLRGAELKAKIAELLAK